MCVFFDGIVSPREPDEYVQIVNLGSETVQMNAWTLTDLDDAGPTFVFPQSLLRPNAQIRVYTNEIHPAWGGFSFQRRSPIWNNSNPDRAALIDPEGRIASKMTYPPGCKP